MALETADFEFISKLVKEQSAIALESGKGYLVTSRLEPLAKQEGFASLPDLVKHLRQGGSALLRYKVIEAMTTNETSFFRDIHPFEALKKHILPQLMKANEQSRQLNIWCAASSSGQEPYTLAMVIRENFPSLLSWSMRIMASDISKEMIRRSREGLYSQLEVNRGLPATLLVKYFQQEGTEWRIKTDVRRMVEFLEVNLSDSWPVLPTFDLVMIRNVLIYFDVETKAKVLGKIRQVLKPNGFLMLGGAETTINIDDKYERFAVEGTSLYKVRK